MDVDQGAVDLNDSQGDRLSQRSWYEADTPLRFFTSKLVMRDDPGVECLEAANDGVAARSTKPRYVTSPPGLVADGLICAARLGQEDCIDRRVDLVHGLGGQPASFRRHTNLLEQKGSGGWSRAVAGSPDAGSTKG